MTDSVLLSILNHGPGKEVFFFQGIKRDRFHFSNTLQRKDALLPVQIYKKVLVGVEKQSEFAGRRRRIESESRSGILYKRQEKAMEKTITKLCLMLAMLHLFRRADAMAIESKGR